DIFYYLFGYSAWWWVVLLLHRVRAGYRRLASHLRAPNQPDPLPRVHWEQGVGFFLLLVGSVGLEALRLYTLGMHLPGRTDGGSGSGGVIGQALAHWSAQTLGFTGGTLALLVLLAIGASLFFSFSWLQVSESVGAWIEGMIRRVRDSYAAREDRRLGEMAKAVRSEQVLAKQEKLVHEQPVRIEPAITVVPKSERVQKEKQQSLFEVAPGEGGLPAISLLDAPAAAQETVSAE